MKVKRLIPIVLSFLMAGTVFFGCRNTPTDTDNTGDTGTEEPETPVTPTDPTPTDPTPTDPTPTDPEPSDPEPVPSTPLPADNKIYVVGDSTVCSFSDNYYLPRYGYGTQLAEYLNVTSSQIVNLALSGRSSKSFLTEANYTTLTSSISEGDYLIIGFGHNDEKSAEPARFTDPAGTIDVETTSKGTSLKWCLNEYYIKVAKEKGATPILCTPIVRYASDGDYTGSEAHIITGYGDYPQAIRDLGEETGTTVVDLTALTKAVYEADNANAIYYHASASYYTASDDDIKEANTYDGSEVPTASDTTHLNKYGAKMVAYQFATAIKSTTCGLAAHVKDNIVAPTKAEDYFGAINQSYVKSPYEVFDASKYTAVNGEWYSTVMGVTGSSNTVSSVGNVTYSAADSKYTINASMSGTKFDPANNVYGFYALFMQIDRTKAFTATAKVTATSLGDVSANRQVAFGMMLRDDIYVDKTKSDLNSNFVAAGIAANNKAIFSCENGTLTEGVKTLGYALNKEYTLTITYTGQTTVVTVSDGTTTVTETYTDFDYVAVDNNYMYLCLFANRTLNVEFTDVNVTITGDAQLA